jgi:hypothetical protein
MATSHQAAMACQLCSDNSSPIVWKCLDCVSFEIRSWLILSMADTWQTNSKECSSYKVLKSFKSCFWCSELTHFAHTRSLHVVSKMATSHQAAMACQLCSDNSSPIVWKCLDCDTFICTKCKQMHKRSKALQAHEIVRIKRNDREISLKYMFMLKPKQLFIIIYVNVCVKRVYPHKPKNSMLFRNGKQYVTMKLLI